MNGFSEGYNFFVSHIGGVYAGQQAGNYVDRINDEIRALTKRINSKQGFNTPIDKLKGNVAEYWHAGTFNINAAVNDSGNRATALESNGFASVDIATSWGENYSSKYYKTGVESAKQQAKSVFEKYKEYQHNGGKDTFEKYLTDRGYSDDSVKHDPIYSGQFRLIPSEQVEEATRWLEEKIASNSTTRPEQVKRYQETLDFLRSKITDNKGNQSIELTTEDSKKLARLAEEGEFDPSKFGLTTEELVGFRNIIQQAFKAGLTSAVITLVLKTAPEVIKAIRYLIESGDIDFEQYKRIGLSAASGAAEGFINGALSAALVTGCESGLLGSALKGVDPSVIGMVTVLTVNAIKNSYKVAKGEMTRYELTTDLVKDMFVGTCGLVSGTIAQWFIEVPILGFMIGNFIGSTLGSFVYQVTYSAALSFCVDTGFTMFGLVDQNYKLPEDVLNELGVDLFDYETFDYARFDFASFEYDKFEPERFETDTIDITFIRRGVIGISKIGYM